jgi:hypothetical protein
MSSMTPKRQVLVLVVLTLLHAGLTIGGFLLYAQTAMEVSNNGLVSVWTTLGQHVKTLFLWPLILPLLRYRPLVLNGLRGLLVVLLNSSLWVAAGYWIYSRLHKRRKRRGQTLL